MKIYALLATVAAISISPAIAQDTAAPAAPTQTSDVASVTTAQQFADVAGVANMFEIQSSQAALQKATSQDIKDFAQRMIDDHTKAGDDLKAAADAQGITVPSELDDAHKQKLDQLNAASGADFDTTYVQMQLDAHHQAVDLFDNFSKAGEDGQVKDFAATTLATLQDHEKAIEQIAQPMNISSGMAAPAPGTETTAQDKMMSNPTDQNAMTANEPTTQDQAAPATPNAVSPAANPMTPAAPAAQPQADNAMGMDVSTLTPVDVGTLKGDDLKGVEVLDPNGNSIASISDFLLTPEGDIDAVIVDFGGFLGIGTKPVAIAFDGLNFVSDQSGKRYLIADVTKEALDAQPPYNKDDYEAKRDAQRLTITK